MPFSIQRSDITKLRVDAIVNAANRDLVPGSGVCGAIFAAAGHERMRRACQEIGGCPVGSAAITRGFALPAKYVIHAVGPIWRGGNANERALLGSAYSSALALAEQHGCRSIAFPLISSGFFGYPMPEAVEVALESIRDFLQTHEMDVILTVLDPPQNLLGRERYDRLRAYIEERGAEQTGFMDESGASSPQPDAGCPGAERKRLSPRDGAGFYGATQADVPPAPPLTAPQATGAQSPRRQMPRAREPRRLKELVNNLDESFNAMLLRLIDEKGMTDVEVYKRANLDRKHFSKLRREGYNPGKPTVLALAIALRLNLDETRDLLRRAGYALSPSSRFDVIVEYCIQEQIYDILEVNEHLFAFDQRLLG